MAKRLGRQPRKFDPRVPLLSAIPRAWPPIPSEINHAAGLPANLGAMLNDTLGDCVEAAAGHAIQLWTFNASGKMLTVDDKDIEEFYEEAGGYVPGNPSTDNGTVIQTALEDWLNGPVDGQELAAYVEVDQRTQSNVRRCIWECGLVQIGFDVPAYMSMNAGAVWDVNPKADNSIIGGHCVDLVGYQTDGLYVVISWGEIYYATQAFIDRFCDEAYALASPDWIADTGESPAGLSLADLELLMSALRWHSDDPRHAHHRHHHKHRRHRHHR